AGGMTPLEVETVLVPSRELEFRLVPESRIRVEVVRRRDGTSIPRVRYRISPDRRGLEQAPSEETEPPIAIAPALRMANSWSVPEARLWIRVEVEGPEEVERRLPFSPGGETTIRIEVGRAAAVEGVVRGPGAKPIAGAQVWALPHRRAGDLLDPSATGALGPATTDAEGRFRLEVDAGGVRLLAAPLEEAWRPFKGLSDPIPIGAGDLAKADIPLAVPGEIRGTISTPSGDPIAGATVGVRFLDAPFGMWRSRREVRTDETGSFRAYPLVPGIHLVSHESSALVVAVEPGGRAEASFRGADPLRDGRRAAGEIAAMITDAGVPLARARVEAVHAAIGWRDETVSDLDGMAQFPSVPPGRVMLRVLAGGAGSRIRASSEATAIEGESARVVLDAADAVLRVRLTASGSPVRGTVRLVRWAGGGADPDTGWLPTDERGERTLGGLPAGRYVIQGRSDAYGDGIAERKLAAGDEAAVTLPIAVSPATLVVEVRDETTGKPLRDAWVRLQTTGGLPLLSRPGPFATLEAAAQTDETGFVDLAEIPAGPVAIGVSVEGRWDRGRIVRALDLPPGAQRRLILAVPAAGALLLRAPVGIGSRLASAAVRVAPVSPPGPGRPTRRLSFGVQFEAGLLPGVWRADVEGDPSRSCEVEIFPGRITRVELAGSD
ncbi:MAG: carboxypeptidase regulatory-like domain-containing protein, partial [Planctomycetes bacterium]|nr:carboxypeptidase regulatory-like domain-containing protein [Planctomycetota bacterium]